MRSPELCVGFALTLRCPCKFLSLAQIEPLREEMKISIKSKFVIATLMASSLIILTGCGGSTGGAAATVAMPNGIYVANGAAKNVKFTPNISNSSELLFQPNSPSQVTGVTVFQDKLYFSLDVNEICCANANNSQVTKFSGGPSTEFGTVYSMAVDKIGRIYVADPEHQRIVRINDISGAGYLAMNLAPFSSGINDAGRSIALDSQGRIYVLCRVTKKVLRFDSMDDVSPESFSADDPGKMNPNMDGFADPFDICIDAQDHIFVTDRLKNRICRFDNMSGLNWKTFGTSGASGPGKFSNLTDISVDSLGQIYAVDTTQGHIVRIKDMNGTDWTTFGSYGNGVGQYTAMNDILVR